MSFSTRAALWPLAVAWVVITGCAATAVAAATDPIPRLDLDRLYSLPWLTGTKPEDPHWAPDSRHLAFLWNDEGTNFYDVWVTDVNGAVPLRVTSMPRPAVAADQGEEIARLAQVEAAESDGGVSAVFWAHDGRHLLFIFHGGLYRVLPGQAPEPLAAAGPPVVAAAASPAADEVAYLSGGALWVVTDGGKTAARRVVDPDRKDVSIESFYWSGDGRYLAFVEADAGRVPVRGIPDYLAPETRLVEVARPFPGEPAESRRLGVVPAAGGEVRWLDLGGDPSDQIFTVAWSPRSDRLLIDKSDLYIKDRRLLVADPDGHEARVLLRETDPHNVTAEWWADWAPDAAGVYFTSDRDDDYQVYYEPLAGGEPRPITGGHFAVFSASVNAAARALFIVTNEGHAEERRAFSVPLRGGPTAVVCGAAGAHKPVPSPDGRWVADVFSDDVTPPDLYLAAVASGRSVPPAPRRVTHSPLPEFQRYRWVAAKYVVFPNVNDGTPLHGRLTLPPDFDPHKTYPAILGSVYSNTVHNEWGGRIYHPTWAIDQYLAQQGYVILNVDISGSSGHGKAFRQRIREDYGGVDVEDLYSGVQYLVAQGYVDRRRVGIWGSSYGGLLTTMSLFTKPGVYRAGVAGAPATSLFHAQTGEMRTMMSPADHAEQYARSSAFLKSNGLKDHLLIIHGMRDDTVLFKDSVTLEQRLILEGHPVDFVPLPNAPHGWDTEGLAQTRYAYHKLVEFFDRYIGAGRPDGAD